MEVEYFSGKTAWAGKQDFFAKVFIMSLCANLAFPIEEKVRKEYNEVDSGFYGNLEQGIIGWDYY